MHHVPYPHRSQELLRAADEYRLAREARARARGRPPHSGSAGRPWSYGLRLLTRPHE